MKRYRICCFDFDARANLLNQPTEGWSDEAKANFQKQIQQVKQSIINEFGIINSEDKIQRFKEIGSKPFSIIAYHNLLLTQIRESYVQGCFYPALTGACTLGERILNHLVLDLRGYYKDKQEPKEEVNSHPCKDCKEFDTLKQKGLIKTEFDIFTCKSCSNWNLMMSNLLEWKILDSEPEQLFRKLSKKRHKSIHFNTKIITNLKEESLEAINILQKIIQKLFPAIGSDYFIPAAKGEPYLRKDLESKPFFKKYYIPNSKLVSPFHEVMQVMPQFVIEDVKEIEIKEISDEEFIKLREQFLNKGTSPIQ